MQCAPSEPFQLLSRCAHLPEVASGFSRLPAQLCRQGSSRIMEWGSTARQVLGLGSCCLFSGFSSGKLSGPSCLLLHSGEGVAPLVSSYTGGERGFLGSYFPTIDAEGTGNLKLGSELLSYSSKCCGKTAQRLLGLRESPTLLHAE